MRVPADDIAEAVVLFAFVLCRVQPPSGGWACGAGFYPGIDSLRSRNPRLAKVEPPFGGFAPTHAQTTAEKPLMPPVSPVLPSKIRENPCQSVIGGEAAKKPCDKNPSPSHNKGLKIKLLFGDLKGFLSTQISSFLTEWMHRSDGFSRILAAH